MGSRPPRRGSAGPTPPRPPDVVLPDLDVADRSVLLSGRWDCALVDGAELAQARLEGLLVLESLVEDAVLDGALLAGMRCTGSRWERVSAVAADGARTQWADTEVADARLSALGLGGARLDRVVLRRCRLDSALLRDAALTDVVLDGCDLRGADLRGAALRRVSFAGSDLTGADLSGARCEDVDLRGATLEELRGADGLRGCTVDAVQLVGLAPVLAAHVGLRLL
ncbi:pentapeptide repeat-containing protein [Streptomyces sp. NP160]|uniref:pentapeptide repeat-containing protein n=1 Tax=Streptomyces sp. NP160 TaxID=2586637 RepID=UPI00111B0E78|nr:pentapeptide repeat-containing protein [Streptomyces sp. NP160]TNM68197.1 pentapeptide repeat-containing protein [Streptomyces sp. NP160]